ncbi:hypothetical protein P4U05_27405 [Bacillus paranthracis]|uniref:hypothetical protein n=1 Tax=Bacillus cereus group TaxID=86661 RepID=UPI000200FB44|nr:MULTISPECIES: hypothetical protein [Bacillus cereus group]ADY23408.1 hypothetical protein YBT020_20900 [Bacillus thuringiensis serovar finitimus YBT-020]MRC73187.1 hypothetical protein [Bacillus thuringiensis]OTX77962.1 hypothetical protein BK722_00530 [Bacillus thuringiensis serovar finitimus]MBM6767142.1 hypothetical protein [Bacillus cereus]MCR6796433.1 hypothetical protein [Bacillus paranthracis]
MKSLIVLDSVVDVYSHLFAEIIKESIKELYNPDFIIDMDEEIYSFSFLDEKIIILHIKEDSVVNIETLSYSSFITKEVIQQLCSIEKLPTRLQRYKRLGEERFRQEIKRDLQNGNIITENNKVYWEQYEITLKLSDRKKLEGV